VGKKEEKRGRENERKESKEVGKGNKEGNEKKGEGMCILSLYLTAASSSLQ